MANIRLEFETPEGLARFILNKGGTMVSLEVGPIGAQHLDGGWLHHLTPAQARTLATALDETAKEKGG